MDELIAVIFEVVTELFGEKISGFFEFRGNKKLPEKTKKVIRAISSIFAILMIGIFMTGTLLLVTEGDNDSISCKLGLIFVIVGGSYIALVVILRIVLHFVTRKKTKKRRR